MRAAVRIYGLFFCFVICLGALACRFFVPAAMPYMGAVFAIGCMVGFYAIFFAATLEYGIFQLMIALILFAVVVCVVKDENPIKLLSTASVRPDNRYQISALQSGIAIPGQKPAGKV